MPNSFKAVCQNKADIEILSRGDISIKPSLKEQKPLSSYVNLNKIDKNHIQLNINELNQILDLNGFNEEHQITFINNNNSRLKSAGRNSIIIIMKKSSDFGARLIPYLMQAYLPILKNNVLKKEPASLCTKNKYSDPEYRTTA